MNEWERRPELQIGENRRRHRRRFSAFPPPIAGLERHRRRRGHQFLLRTRMIKNEDGSRLVLCQIDFRLGLDRVNLTHSRKPNNTQQVGDVSRAIQSKKIRPQVSILNNTFSSNKSDRFAAKRAGHVLAELAKNEDVVNMIVDGGAVPALVRQLQAPPVAEMGGVQVAFEHEMEKGCAFVLGLLAVKVHIVQRGAVHPLIDMLESPNIQIKEMSAFALGRLAQDTHNQAGVVHIGGSMPLLKLLDSKNGSLQHNAAFALYGLADNEDNISDFFKVGGVQKLLDGEFIVQATKDCVAKTLKRIEEKIHGRLIGLFKGGFLWLLLTFVLLRIREQSSLIIMDWSCFWVFLGLQVLSSSKMVLRHCLNWLKKSCHFLLWMQPLHRQQALESKGRDY